VTKKHVNTCDFCVDDFKSKDVLERHVRMENYLENICSRNIEPDLKLAQSSSEEACLSVFHVETLEMMNCLC
jgi:hypothetical protein